MSECGNWLLFWFFCFSLHYCVRIYTIKLCQKFSEKKNIYIAKILLEFYIKLHSWGKKNLPSSREFLIACSFMPFSTLPPPSHLFSTFRLLLIFLPSAVYHTRRLSKVYPNSSILSQSVLLRYNWFIPMKRLASNFFLEHFPCLKKRNNR